MMKISQLLPARKSPQRPFSEYISFKETLEAAKKSGLSVGEFIERKHCDSAVTPLEATVNGWRALGVFESNLERVCEIGPGSGRYLDAVFSHCPPREYEIYETSREWRQWLSERHPVIARTCDGRTLSETPSTSMDLVHANKVFPGLPFLTTMSYLQEMARVVREDGWVVFDVLTETCFSNRHLKAWFDANPWNWAWAPQMISRGYLVNYFAGHGLVLAGSFHIPLFPAVTECMLFRKKENGTENLRSLPVI